MDSLKFHPGPPCSTLLCPAGGPPQNSRPFRGSPAHKAGGLQLSSTPLDTQRPTGLFKCVWWKSAKHFVSFLLTRGVWAGGFKGYMDPYVSLGSLAPNSMQCRLSTSDWPNCWSGLPTHRANLVKLTIENLLWAINAQAAIRLARGWPPAGYRVIGYRRLYWYLTGPPMTITPQLFYLPNIFLFVFWREN
jgi:hypothetical protein